MNAIDKNEEFSRQDRIKALIVRFGEKSSVPLRVNVEMLSKALSKDLEQYKDFIVDILFQCVVHLTPKTSIYGTLVGLLNANNPEFGEIVSKRASNFLVAALKDCDFSRIAILTKFAAELVVNKVVALNGYLEFLDSFLSVLRLEQPQRVRDYFFYSVASTLPHCGAFMLKEEPDQLAQILRKLSSYMDNRKSLKSDFYSPVNNESSINYSEDYLQIYWENMLKASDSEWQSGVIVSLKKDFVEKFGNSKTHILDPIFFETSLFNDKRPEFCQVLSILPKKRESNLDTLLLFEYFGDILLYFEETPKECAEKLLFQVNDESDLILLIEAIFSHMFQLPNSQSSLVLYVNVVDRLIRMKPDSVPKILAKAIFKLFEQIDFIDLECRDRFIDFFSLHLTNFGYKWAWNEMSFVTTLSKTSPKRLFVKELLLTCNTINPLNQILANSPLLSLLPKITKNENIKNNDKKDENDDKKEKSVSETSETILQKATEYFNNSGDNLNMQNVVQRYVTIIKSKEDVKEVLKLDEKTKILDFGLLKEEEKILRVGLLFLSILEIGSEELSSLFCLFDSFKPVLMEMKSGRKEQKAIVEITVLFWSKNKFRLGIVLPKLVTYGFVEPDILIETMLSENSLIKFYDSFYSRVLEKIIDLYSKRINGLRRIKEKEYSDESQESLKGREEVNQTIMTTFNDRQNLLKLIICRLAASSDFISSKDSDFLNNEIFKAIFGRLVMFLRKFREDIKRMEETLKKAYFDQNQSNPSTKAFKLIIAN